MIPRMIPRLLRGNILRNHSSVLKCLQYRPLTSDVTPDISSQQRKDEIIKHPIDIRAATDKILTATGSTGLAKASDLLQIFYNVQTKEDLEVAEEALIAFRKGINPPRPSLAINVVRACIRAGSPENALKIICDKRKYGVFPSANVYNVIMRSFLTKDPKNIVYLFQELLTDELKPTPGTYKIVVIGYMLMETDDGFENALHFSKECLKNFPNKLEPYHHVLKNCIKQGNLERVKTVLQDLSQFPPKNKFELCCHLDGYILLKEYESALALVSSVNEEKNQSVMIPESILKEFTDKLEEDDKREELQKLQEITELLKSNGKISLKVERETNS